MKTYELTFLFNPNEDAAKAQKQIEGWIKDFEGKVLKKENWGVKNLAYNIKKESRALYLFFEAELSESVATAINKKKKLTENILRHLIIAKS